MNCITIKPTHDSVIVCFFLRLLLRCIVIIDQTLTMVRRRNRVLMHLRPRWVFGAVAQHNIHLTFCAFCADLVILPLVGAFFSTALITPTATVWRMSRTANLPEDRCHYCRLKLEYYHHIGIEVKMRVNVKLIKTTNCIFHPAPTAGW